jgi:hypothetical protein
MLFSIVCAFLAAFVFSVHNCTHTTDRYAASPFGLDFIVIDVVIALLCGTVVSVFAIGLAALGFRRARLSRLTDVRFLVVIMLFYVILTTSFCVFVPADSGGCRLDF